MKVLFYTFIVFVFGVSCKYNQKGIQDKISISGKVQTEIGGGAISSTLELFIEGNYISKIDSTHNGLFNFDVSNIYYNKTGYLVLSNVNLIVEKMKLMPSGYFPCETETDTISIVLNSYKNRKIIVVKPCKGKQVNYPSKHY